MAYGKIKVDTLTYDDSGSNVDVTVSSLAAKVGSASPTFTGDVTLTGASANVVFDASDNALEFANNAKATFGDGLEIFHDSNHAYIKDTGTGRLKITTNGTGVDITNADGSETIAAFATDGAVELYENGTKRCETTTTGINVTGTAVTDGLTVAGASDFTGQLKEAVTVTAGKLSDNLNLDIANGNVFLFTTAESTTSTPNIRYDGSTTLDSKMAVGDCLSVTIITTANASAFSAQLTIDGAAVTENWTGGSAPSAGGSSGVDIHAYTIIKTASNTYTVIANHTKTS